MQIVIDIPEEEYKDIKYFGTIVDESRDYIASSILNGIPLPKGHGRLIDVDELFTSERPKGITDDVWKESHIYKLLSNAPTIIEADKE